MTVKNVPSADMNGTTSLLFCIWLKPMALISNGVFGSAGFLNTGATGRFAIFSQWFDSDVEYLKINYLVLFLILF
jgi:hypothetical protein